MLTNWTAERAKENLELREINFKLMISRGYKEKSNQYIKAKNKLKAAQSCVDVIGNFPNSMAVIHAEIEAGAIFFVSHSGGKDSQIMYHLIHQLVPANQIVVVHADLGRAEWSGVKEHINANINHDLNVVKAVNKAGQDRDLLDTVYERAQTLKSKGKKAAPWFSPAQRYCTSSFKTGPITKFIRNYLDSVGNLRGINCIGMRGEESIERSDNVTLELNESLNTRPNRKRSGPYRKVLNWLPIQDMLLEGDNGVWALISRAGQTPHPVYAKGMSRLSCSICCMSSKSDLKTAASLAPDLFALYVQAEKDLGYTMFQGKTLEEMADTKAQPVKVEAA